jgi:hypothetical protein
MRLHVVFVVQRRGEQHAAAAASEKEGYCHSNCLHCASSFKHLASEISMSTSMSVRESGHAREVPVPARSETWQRVEKAADVTGVTQVQQPVLHSLRRTRQHYGLEVVEGR